MVAEEWTRYRGREVRKKVTRGVNEELKSENKYRRIRRTWGEDRMETKRKIVVDAMKGVNEELKDNNRYWRMRKMRR